MSEHEPTAELELPDDVEAFLEEHQAFGIFWDICHVRDQRPDLTNGQAWQVLQECQRLWDRLDDPMLKMIGRVTHALFPRKRTTRAPEFETLLACYGSGEARDALVDLLADAMHWCDRNFEDFDGCREQAAQYFQDEIRATTNRSGGRP